MTNKMDETGVRCPYCDKAMSLCYNGFTHKTLLRCGTHADYHVVIIGEDEADCIRQASDLKLVDRLVKEAVEAERERCATIGDEEPKAWMVYYPVGCEFDYRVFFDRSDAVDEIDKQRADGHDQPDLIPLFAGKPIEIDD